jgi:hypothetical protein
MTRVALNNFRSLGQALRVALRGGVIIIQLDADHISPPISAAVKIDIMAWKQNEQTGQVYRQQTAYAHVSIGHLPDWATEDVLPLTGKIEIDGKWFKISSVDRNDVTLRITANYWPDSSD